MYKIIIQIVCFFCVVNSKNCWKITTMRKKFYDKDITSTLKATDQ